MWSNVVSGEIAELFEQPPQWGATVERTRRPVRQSFNGVPLEVINAKRTSTRARNRELRRAVSGRKARKS